MEALTPVVGLWLVLATLIGFAFGSWGRGRRVSGRELTLKREFDNRLAAVEEDGRRALERARIDSETARRKLVVESDALRAQLSKLDAGRFGATEAAPSAPTDDHASRAAREGAAAGPADRVDDLKLIKGIGPAFESRLNELGFTSYRDLALWTAEDLIAVGTGLGAKVRLKEWSARATELHLEKYGSPV